MSSQDKKSKPRMPNNNGNSSNVFQDYEGKFGILFTCPVEHERDATKEAFSLLDDVYILLVPFFFCFVSGILTCI